MQEFRSISFKPILLVSIILLVFLFFIPSFANIGPTWDEYLYYQGVRDSFNLAKDYIIHHNSVDFDIFGDLEYFTHFPRIIPYILSKTLSTFQTTQILLLSDIQLFILNTFIYYNHLSSILFSISTSVVLYFSSLFFLDRKRSFLVAFALLLYPAWIGNSFFNNADIPLAFFYTTFSLLSLRHPPRSSFLASHNVLKYVFLSKTYHIIRALIIGLMLATRPSSLFFILFSEILLLVARIILRITERRSLSSYLSLGLLYSGLPLFIYIIFTPASWYGPIPHLIKSITYITTRQEGSSATVFFYIVNTILTATPLFFAFGLVSFAVAFLVNLTSFRKPPIHSPTSSYSIYNHIVFILQFLLAPTLLVISGRSLYNDLRHILFIFPPLSLISVLGLLYLYRFISSAKNIYLLRLHVLISLSLIFILLTENILLFPFNYVYNSETARLHSVAQSSISSLSNNKYLRLDYAGISLNSLFGACIKSTFCNTFLKSEDVRISQYKQDASFRDSYNKDIFNASTKLLTRPPLPYLDSSVNSQLDSTLPSDTSLFFVTFDGDASSLVSNSGCTQLVSVTRNILIPFQKVPIASILTCKDRLHVDSSKLVSHSQRPHKVQ